jgi:hypothetical protein
VRDRGGTGPGPGSDTLALLRVRDRRSAQGVPTSVVPSGYRGPVTETVRMLVPLDQVLFGWPEVAPTTPLQELGLLVGVPLVVVVLVFAVAKGHAVLVTSKRGPGPHPDDPVWEGGRARSIMGGADDELPAVESGARRELEGSASPATAETDAGGASARW